MSAPKILDMRIQKVAAGWQLYIPIKTGHLEVIIDARHDNINRFLETAYNTPVRRFGEDPE